MHEEFCVHLDEILNKFKETERRILLVVRAQELQDPLYEAFCEYEQLKIFLRMNLSYGKTLFKKPFEDYKKLLKRLKSRMVSPDDVRNIIEEYGGDQKKLE